MTTDHPRCGFQNNRQFKTKAQFAGRRPEMIADGGLQYICSTLPSLWGDHGREKGMPRGPRPVCGVIMAERVKKG